MKAKDIKNHKIVRITRANNYKWNNTILKRCDSHLIVIKSPLGHKNHEFAIESLFDTDFRYFIEKPEYMKE